MPRSMAYGLGVAGGVITFITGLMIIGAGSLLGSYLHLISYHVKTALWFAGFWGVVIGLFMAYSAYMIRTTSAHKSWSIVLIFVGILGYLTLQGFFVGPGAAIIGGIIGLSPQKKKPKKKIRKSRRSRKRSRR